jgi:hypothetical protein
MAQTYTEIFEGGWGLGIIEAKPFFIDLDNDGLLDLILGRYDGYLKHYEQESAGSTDFILISNRFNAINVGSFSAPSFTDLDNDGLLDLVIGEQHGVLTHYEQNETGKIEFTLITENFNGIDVGGKSTPVFTDLDNDGLRDLIVGKQDGGLNHYKQDAAGSTSFTLQTENLSAIDIGKWSAPTIVDLDNDGLLDLLIGENVGNVNHYKQSSAGSSDFTLITEDFNSIYGDYHSACFLIDLDNDNLLDLILGDSPGFLYHYKQSGMNSLTFNYRTDRFITGEINVGSNSDPCITDLDQDGLLDLFIGEYDGNINHYEQSAPGSSHFTKIAQSFNYIEAGIYSTPFFIDIDNNGLLDLIVGENGGTLDHYEQDAVGSSKFSLIMKKFNGIDVGALSKPFIIDLDNNDLLDLIIGEEYGSLFHYEQNTAGSTEFTLITDSLSGINVGEWAAPSFTDLDNDGLLDLIVGEYEGNINHFEQDAVNSRTFTLVTENFNNIQVENYSKPVFADVNSDGLDDMFVGKFDGGVHYYQRIDETKIDDDPERRLYIEQFKLFSNYPNPFNASTTIHYDISQTDRVNISIYNTAGQRIQVLVDEIQQSGSHSVRWNSTDEYSRPLTSGLYFCRMQAGGYRHSVKLMLIR